MKPRKLLLALPAVAVFAATLPASADVVYYTTTNSAVIPSNTVLLDSSPVSTYVDTTGTYYTSPYVTSPVVTTPVVTSYPAVYPSTTTVDRYGHPVLGSTIGKTVGGAALGAGVGALGGLLFGAISGHGKVGRSVLGGTAAGAAIGGGLGLFNGLFNRQTVQPQVAAPGYYWY